MCSVLRRVTRERCVRIYFSIQEKLLSYYYTLPTHCLSSPRLSFLALTSVGAAPNGPVFVCEGTIGTIRHSCVGVRLPERGNVGSRNQPYPRKCVALLITDIPPDSVHTRCTLGASLGCPAVDSTKEINGIVHALLRAAPQPL